MMQFVNNYVVLHSRTAYEDRDEEAAQAVTYCGYSCARRRRSLDYPDGASATATRITGWASGAPIPGRRRTISST